MALSHITKKGGKLKAMKKWEVMCMGGFMIILKFLLSFSIASQ